MIIPCGKHTKNYGKSPFLMGKSTINGHFEYVYITLWLFNIAMV